MLFFFILYILSLDNVYVGSTRNLPFAKMSISRLRLPGGVL